MLATDTKSFIATYGEVEARFVLAGEVFERKSVEYRTVYKAVTWRDKTFLHVRATYPDGTVSGVETLVVRSRLVLNIIGRWA